MEAIKKHANEVFELQNYSQAIHLYNQAIHMAPDLPILYGNRAAAYLKRNWLASEFCFTDAVCLSRDMTPYKFYVGWLCAV